MAQESIKTNVKQKYGKIALTGNSECCCMPQDCCESTDNLSKKTLIAIGYGIKDIESLPNESVLEAGTKKEKNLEYQ
jgi:hypothetical protein